MQSGSSETVGVREAGARLGVGRCTVYKLAATGWLGPVRVLRVGRQLRVPLRELDRALGIRDKEEEVV
ncbi:MAG: excisionase family DNA-binding protein [Armatimonadetes bacterium]|nr:excisionase family DNA-binding protein [Armatimonadota bacterium]